MRLIVLSAPDHLVDEAAVINGLFEAGMDLFHIRKPHSGIAEVRTLIEGIDPAYHHLLVLHQHHVLCDAFGLTRRHYPEALRQQQDAQCFADLQQQGIRLSTSIHHLQSLPGLSAFEYVFFSPVFNSISKVGYYSKLAAEFKCSSIPGFPAVFALGGISADNIAEVSAMNFDGVGVLGAIWNMGQCPLDNFRLVQRACQVLQSL